MAPELSDLGMVTDAVWIDYDNDQDQDLAVVGNWMLIEIFENENGRFTKINDPNLQKYTGWWNCIDTGDFDGDGDEDLIAGNFGLNSAFKTSTSEPLRINYGDFDNNGTYDIVLSYVEGSVRYPVSSKGDIIQQYPALKQKFQDYHSYASASLEQVFGQSIASNSQQLEAATFAHCYIENNGKRGFKISALPVATQTSSVNDVLVHDFNGDGKLDVLTAGNFYPIETNTPRNDAGTGTLLLGNGDGSFVSVHNEESGVYLANDLRNLGLANTANGKIIIAANNSEKIQLLDFDD